MKRFFAIACVGCTLVACSGSDNQVASPGKDGGSNGGSDADAASMGAGGALGGRGGTGGAGGSIAAGGSGGAEAGPSPCVPGGTWTIVDDYLAQGARSMNPEQLFVTAPGAIYATGIVQRQGSASGLIRKSTDGASFTDLPAANGLGGDVAVAPDGTMFAIGATGNARVTGRSRDGGQTWTPVDSVPLAPNSPCNTGFLDMDSGGILYSAASCDVEGWIVRKSENGGDTWTDVERFFLLEAGAPARLSSIAVDGGDRVFVAGNSVQAGVTHWIVRRLSGAATFATVDDFELEVGMGGDTPRVNASGAHVYASGMANTSAGPHWIVRRGDASGGVWATLDDFTYPNATRVVADAVHEGAGGVLVAVGSVTDAGGVTRIVTRRSTDDGNTWSATDEWTYSPGKSSSVGSIAADRSGNVYALARGVASDDVGHWIVRKLACASP
jgi:hypothetical protein